MDQNIADLLGIDLTDPAERAEVEAVQRDMSLVERLVRTRVDLGLTQKQVADRMGVSQPTVSDFERLGGDPHLSTVRRYALAIGVVVRHSVSAPSERVAGPMLYRTRNDATRAARSVLHAGSHDLVAVSVPQTFVNAVSP